MPVQTDKIPYIVLVMFLLFWILKAGFLHEAFAENVGELARDVQLGELQIGELVGPGYIISSWEGVYQLSSQEYSRDMVGVTVDAPSVSLKILGTGSVPIVNGGVAYVKVSTINGAINAGDFITSSKIKGVGMKATDKGYVIGVAQESYDENDPSVYKNIKVEVQIGLADTMDEAAFGKALKSLLAGVKDLRTLTKYVVAGAIAILSFGFGFLTFGKIASKGLEALGRSPLAKKSIYASMIINSVIAVGIVFVGLIISFLVYNLI